MLCLVVEVQEILMLGHDETSVFTLEKKSGWPLENRSDKNKAPSLGRVVDVLTTTACKT